MEPPQPQATGLEPRAGRLLVAAPMLVDPNFERTVVLLLEANDEGALGVVLNRPGEVPVADVLADWDAVVGSPSVLFQGGPVSPEAALGVGVLGAGRSPGSDPVGWRGLHDGYGLVDLDAPLEVVGPALASLRIFAGYAGWGAGQLEDEIDEGAWFVVEGSAADAASQRPERLWPEVLRRQPSALRWLATYPADPALN